MPSTIAFSEEAIAGRVLREIDMMQVEILLLNLDGDEAEEGAFTRLERGVGLTAEGFCRGVGLAETFQGIKTTFPKSHQSDSGWHTMLLR